MEVCCFGSQWVGLTDEGQFTSQDYEVPPHFTGFGRLFSGPIEAITISISNIAWNIGM
jgi:hypothetical protein